MSEAGSDALLNDFSASDVNDEESPASDAQEESEKADTKSISGSAASPATKHGRGRGAKRNPGGQGGRGGRRGGADKEAKNKAGPGTKWCGGCKKYLTKSQFPAGKVIPVS